MGSVSKYTDAVLKPVLKGTQIDPDTVSWFSILFSIFFT